MAETENENSPEHEKDIDRRILEFTAVEAERASSDSLLWDAETAAATEGALEAAAESDETEETDDAAETPTEEKQPERSPAFLKLADPQLPTPKKQNRARLQMQSPTKLYFYWSMSEDPFQKLNRAFAGRPDNYTLVLKLIDKTRGTEQIMPCEASGSWWFDVESGREYHAEVGFYSPSRPFVRAMFSNSVATPKQSPSRVPSRESQWAVSADKFAEVLDVSGFKRDAFDVALAGDDTAHSDRQAAEALQHFTHTPVDIADFHPEDIRYALFALASGFDLNDLRHRIGSRLFALMEDSRRADSRETARKTIEKHFAADAADEITEEFVEPFVFGESRIHFQKRFRRVPRGEFLPVSSPGRSFR